MKRGDSIAIVCGVILCGATAFADDDCGAPKRLRGIDVSTYQGEIDWTRVKKAGVAFAFARVSDGVDTVDDRFAANFAAMRRAGVRRGAYQFFRAGADARAQADLAISTVKRLGGADLPLVADVETDDGEKLEVLAARLTAWLRRVERRTGARPIIYTSPSMGRKLDAKFGAWRLWIAHYEVECPTLPDAWKRWHFWQHSSTGKVDGIAGRVDLDLFAGTLTQLRRLR
ncbi:MAG TPA: GH25 family lysozyme [Polyangia bacterium]|nr:GH25 family lysozyme [Polyangia bacterium]